MPRTLSRRRFLLGRRPTVEAPVPGGRLVAEVGGACLAALGVSCSTCADPCEPRALRLIPVVGGRALPVIDPDFCSGCGDCLPVCPVGALSLAPTPEIAPCA